MSKEQLIIIIAIAASAALFNVAAFLLVKADHGRRSREMNGIPLAVMIAFGLLGGIGFLLGVIVYKRPKRGEAAVASTALGLGVLLIAGGIFLTVYQGPLFWEANGNERTSEDSKNSASESTEVLAEATPDTETDTERETGSSTETGTDPGTETDTKTSTDADPSASKSEPAAGPVRITIRAIGDMLMHPGVSGLAVQPDGTLNYDFIYDAIREDIESADIAVVNNEVPFGGNRYGLRNYPAFNVFTELGDAELKAGFDVMLYATNHVRDMGTNGILNTMAYWKDHPEALILGVHETPQDQKELKIIEKNGVKIALFNYVYGINAGFPFDRPYLVDCMRAQDQAKIREELERAEREADFTIVFPHWGSEYQLRESESQRAWAAFFTECGADLIIGTHPHVLQPYKTVRASNGNVSLCYYSLGNYISQQDETISMVGGMAEVTLAVRDGAVSIEDHGMQYLVTDYDTTISYARTLKLEDYTEEMALRHGIHVNALPGDGAEKGSHLNARYPMTLGVLLGIAEDNRRASE